MLTQQAHTYRVGDLVQTEYNDGPGAGSVYGLITSAGPKQCGVTWESGRRQILHKDRWHLVKRVPDDAREPPVVEDEKQAPLPKAEAFTPSWFERFLGGIFK
jgi:hypothetical protein